jgi:hypothetical protein
MKESLLLTFTNLISMKKNFSLRIIAGAGLCLFLGLNATAQIMDANLTVDEAIPQYVTVNKAMPFHVTPDPYFNPNYIGPGWLVSASEVFTWTAVPAAGVIISNSAIINPDVTFPSVADYTLNVIESNADCAGGPATSLTVHVLAAPTFDFNGLADILDNCGPVAAMDVTFAIANNGADAVDGTGAYLVDWTYDVDELAADKSTVLVDHAGDLDATHTDASFTTSGIGKVLVNQAFAVLGGHVTRYIITLTGINEAVSRQSDYIAPRGRNIASTAFTNYAPGVDNTFTVMVLPAPTTGPIYHVPNL